MKLTVIRVGKVALQGGVGAGRANTVNRVGVPQGWGAGTILGRGRVCDKLSFIKCTVH